MPTYNIYYQGVKVVTLNPPDEQGRYPLDVYGMHYIDFAKRELWISCDAKDVQVTKDGEDVTLKLIREITMDDIRRVSPPCACAHVDARICTAIRYNRDIENVDRDDACECYCHSEAEEENDEYTFW